MSHHGNPPQNPAMHEMMKKLMGEYPQGRLNQNDAGALAMSVAVQNGKVIVEFPKPVAWFGMTPKEAIGMAEMLISKARAAGAKEPLTVKIG